jgi:hypothetical protein
LPSSGLRDAFVKEPTAVPLDASSHEETDRQCPDQQVDGEVSAANLKRVITADEAEIVAQFDEELFDSRSSSRLRLRINRLLVQDNSRTSGASFGAAR